MTYSPRLKAGASTVNMPAKADLRLTGTLVGRRCPCALDVNRRVVIAVNGEATITRQSSISKGEIVLLSASRTYVSGGREAVNFDNSCAALEGYPLQSIDEFTKSKVTDFASPQRFHARQVQVLKVQDGVVVAQVMGELEMVITTLVGDVGLMLCQGAAGLLVTVGAFDFARQFTSQVPGLAKFLLIELRALVALAFIIDEKILQTKVEAAAFTRAGLGDEDVLDDTEDKPQPAHAISLDGQRFEATT